MDVAEYLPVNLQSFSRLNIAVMPETQSRTVLISTAVEHMLHANVCLLVELRSFNDPSCCAWESLPALVSIAPAWVVILYTSLAEVSFKIIDPINEQHAMRHFAAWPFYL